ncbi:MAG: hypothetical protein KJO69_01735 [Gammaproteobacteria bacterium]|nr:hypothetical protein [Gammaproteobacteria bacterium]NNJ71853.1 hypothetical protein [Enterobacterales bacterium]
MLTPLLIVVWIMLGLFATIPLVVYAHRININQAAQVLGRGLIVAASVYVIFAVIWGDISWIGVEIAGLLIYSAFYLVPSKRIMLWVGTGWLLHILWVLGWHNFGPGAVYSPLWYVFVSSGFNLVIFVYCIYRWRHDQNVILERSFSRYESARGQRKR